MPDLFRYIYEIILNHQHLSYEVFGDFLKHVLMLVVGLELMIMILNHSYESILTLVLFVIARKMLVYAESMNEILIGTISIALIFFVLKFLLKDNKMLAKLDNTFSAALPVDKVKTEFGFDLPTDISHTLGGLMYELAKREGIKELKQGVTMTYGKYRFTLVAVTEGTIERIRIDD
ncbi:MAG: transporter associated domain-containing protein [Tissierellia bacterium]|nr:transporter associated domain-containing protein [Tissierellia bacterium]